MSRRKTLLVSDIFPPKTGGSGRWFWEIYSRLPRDQYVIAAGESERQDEFDSTHDLNLRRVALQLKQWGIFSVSGFLGYWRVARQLKKIVRDEGIKMLHCGRCLPEGVAASALRTWIGVPYACYVHGEDVNTAANSREYMLLVKRALRKAEFVVANSNNTRDLLINNWDLPPEKVVLLHPGVDIERFVPVAPNPEVRRELGWEQKKVVLTVGRLQKRKGHDQLIAAIPKIRQQVPDVLYSIIGDGEELEVLKAQVDGLGLEKHVQFQGEISDEQLIQAYQQCDVFALPNREVDGDIEGFGMVLLEAQACARPVIAGASGGTSETMQDPATGRVVPCETPEHLEIVIQELLLDEPLRQKMGLAGRAWVEQNFGWESLTRMAASVFDRNSPPEVEQKSPESTSFLDASRSRS